LKLIGEWGRGIKENDGGNEFKYVYLIYCKNFCKGHNVPLPGTTIKQINNMSLVAHPDNKGRKETF
jgi:hypothetical protein